MEPFEFVFALYSLLLGLSMVELLGGLGRSLEVRLSEPTEDKRIEIGWLTPLLAIFVMLDLLSFWGAAWAVRNDIIVSGHSLFGIAAFASAYFLASRLVFPSDPAKLRNLDTHYFRIRRPVVGILLALLAAQLALYASLPSLQGALLNPLALIMTAILVVLMIAAMVAKSYRASLAILIALIARYLMIYMI